MLLPGCGADQQARAPIEAHAAAAAPPRPGHRETAPDGIRELRGVAVTGARGSLVVARAMVRHRTGFRGFITYNDFTELLLVDAAVTLGHEAGGFASILEALDDTLGGFAPSDGAEPLDPTRVEALLTRLVFDGLSIEQHAWARPLRLRAASGRLGFDTGALVLEERVELEAPDGTRARAPRAVLARDHDGMFLPLGHTRDGVAREGAAFLALDAEGRLSATVEIPRIHYEDLIAQREQLLLAHYAERAPPALRPLLLAVLGQLGVPPGR